MSSTSLITSAEKEYPRNIIGGGGREGEVKFKPNTLNCTKTTFDVNPKFYFSYLKLLFLNPCFGTGILFHKSLNKRLFTFLSEKRKHL